MLKNIKQRLGRDDEQGFTLIELMVVLLIIAILLAIAIPVFLGAKNSANARSSQSNLRNALTAEQSTWTNNQVFDDTTANMTGLEPSLNWVNGAVASEGGNTVSVTTGKSTAAADTVFLEAYAKDGNCYVIEQTNDPAVTAGSTGYAIVKGASCPALTHNVTTFVPVTAGAAGQAAAANQTIANFYQTW